MRGYAQYCPIAKASEILGDRWTLLIVREMLGGAGGFNELQRGLPGISRSVLTDRLRSLERAEIVERRTGPKGKTLGYRLTDVGLSSRAFPLQILVALTGLTLGVFEYSIFSPDPLTAGPTLRETWLPALILLFCTGFVEELVFRGIMQRAARQVLGNWGVIHTALVFAVLHVGYHSVPNVLFVLGVALFFGMVTVYTRSIVGVSLAHGLTNIFLFLALPFGRNPFDLITDVISRLR